MRQVSFSPHRRTASNTRSTPVASTLAVNSENQNLPVRGFVQPGCKFPWGVPCLPLAEYSSSHSNLHSASESSVCLPDVRYVRGSPPMSGGWYRVRHNLFPIKFGQERTVLSCNTCDKCYFSFHFEINEYVFIDFMLVKIP